jgi:hypothetical protein
MEPTTTLPRPATGGGGSGKLGTMLGAVALAVAVVAVGLAFAVPGPVGATGATGGGPSSGAPPVDLFAVVGSDGSFARGSGTWGSELVATGEFQVNFTQILYGCTYTASLGTTAYGDGPAGSATVSTIPGDYNDLRVYTYNHANVATDEPFHLIALCPAGLSVVVDANATFVSGAGVNSSISEGTGTYQVLFNQNVAGCAYVGGLGSGSGTAPAGSAAFASRVSNVDGVWIDTYNSTGAGVNEEFHLTVYC